MPRAKDPGLARSSQPGSNAKLAQLQAHAAPSAAHLTTAQGVRLADNHHSLRAGPRGPTLLQDFLLREKLTHFNHERIAERVVNARGAGAHGWFQVYESLATYTRAAFLQDPQQRTPVFVRFSSMTGARGSADTVRDTRGFAVKFYTSEGNYDLVGQNMPVSFVQDAMKFPDLVHALKPEPHHDMPQASSAHDTFWDFASLMPETTHMLLWRMSDRALPRSWRMMEGFGVHTFRLVNARGDAVFAKFHWKPRLGVHALAEDEARQLAGIDPDFHRRDLWEAIERGQYPEWELGLQIIDADRADEFGVDLLDPTKLMPEELVPVQRVGRLVLDRNPDNAFAETEQVAFHPGHVVPGIDFSNDPLLQGRLFAYTDAHVARLGGPNHHELPINRSLCPFHNFQRDGLARQTVHRGRAAYEPNTLGQAGAEFRVDGEVPAGDEEDLAPTPRGRRASAGFDDHFSQAALFWHSQSAAEKDHIVQAFRHELSLVEQPAVRQRVVDNLAHVDAMLARRVAAPLGIVPDPRAAAGRAGFRGERGRLPLEESAALRCASQPPSGSRPIATRRVAVLVADGVNVQSLRPVLQVLEEAGARCVLLAPRLGQVATEGGRQLAVEQALAVAPSVLFDAVLVADGAAARALAELPLARRFVQQAWEHGKTLCAIGAGALLLGREGGPGVVLLDGQPDAARAAARGAVDAIARHRHWERTAEGA